MEHTRRRYKVLGIQYALCQLLAQTMLLHDWVRYDIKKYITASSNRESMS